MAPMAICVFVRPTDYVINRVASAVPVRGVLMRDLTNNTAMRVCLLCCFVSCYSFSGLVTRIDRPFLPCQSLRELPAYIGRNGASLRVVTLQGTEQQSTKHGSLSALWCRVSASICVSRLQARRGRWTSRGPVTGGGPPVFRQLPPNLAALHARDLCSTRPCRGAPLSLCFEWTAGEYVHRRTAILVPLVRRHL